MHHAESPSVPASDSVPAPVHDDLFGEITVQLDVQEGRLMVEGELIPRVTLRRDPEADVDEHVAIGTREGERLRLTVGGAEATLRLGKGGISRRSYRVDVEHDGVRYRLVPDSVPSSRLTRDGAYVGDFLSDGDGRVIAEWRDRNRDRTGESEGEGKREGPDVQPVDAAIGYALAAAFGTGGQPWWMMAADAVSSALP
ncbi:hypothetical protein [Streptomyces apocyni]|uniref:hypothetical protein n=1 Tax=Streptomyces apocyni TaxID=2654677 RepID=UPI0012E99A59|nr:hypothetical protein [Streptomyces apocyni]